MQTDQFMYPKSMSAGPQCPALLLAVPDLQDLGSDEQCMVAHQKLHTGAQTAAWVWLPAYRDACQQFSEIVWVEPAYRCAAADGYKTTTIFSAFKNCAKIQYAADLEWQKTFRRDDSKKKIRQRKNCHVQVVVTTATCGTG